MARKSNTRKSKEAASPVEEAAQVTPSRRSVRTPKPKVLAGSEPSPPPTTPSQAGRSRRSSTAAQTAASVADSRSTRSSRGRRSSSASSGSVKDDSPRSRAKSQRIIKKVTYFESDGEEEAAAKPPVAPDDEFNAEEEQESDSGDSLGKKQKAVASPTRARGKAPAKSKPSPKGSRSSRRGRKLTNDDEEDEEEMEEEVATPKAKAAPTRRGRFTEPASDEEQDKTDSPKPTAPTRRGRFTEPASDEDNAEDKEEEEQEVKSPKKGRGSATRGTKAAKRKEPTPVANRRPGRGRKNAKQDEEEEEEVEESAGNKRKADDEIEEEESAKKSKIDKKEAEEEKGEEEGEDKVDGKESKDEKKEAEEEEPMEVDKTDEEKKDEKKEEVKENKTDPEKKEPTKEAVKGSEAPIEPTKEEPKPETEPKKTEEPETAKPESPVKQSPVVKTPSSPAVVAKPSTPVAKTPPVKATTAPTPVAKTPSPVKATPAPLTPVKATTAPLTSVKATTAPLTPVKATTAPLTPIKATTVPLTPPATTKVSTPTKVATPTKPEPPKEIEPSNNNNNVAESKSQSVPSSSPITDKEPASATSASITVVTAATANKNEEINGVHEANTIDYSVAFKGRKFVLNKEIGDEVRSQCQDRTMGVICYNLAGEAPKPLENFVTAVRTVDSELLCLQAVSEIFYKGYLESTFNAMGYKGIFHAPGQHNTGFATFYKSATLCLKSQKTVSLKQAIIQDIQSALPADDRISVSSRLPQCGDVLFTQFNFTGSSDKSRCLVVANILIPPSDLNVQALQMSCLAREAIQFLDGANHPVILCGSFNMKPTDASYELLRDGYLSNDMIEILQSKKDFKVPSKEENTSLVNLLWKSFQHSTTGLKSCYASALGKELPVGVSSEMIWFSSSSLHILGVLDAPEIKSQEQALHTSNRLLLKADLAFYA